MDFFEIVLNFLKAFFLGLMAKTGIGSPIMMFLLTGLLAGLLFKTYKDR
jgi:hypothetical protein